MTLDDDKPIVLKNHPKYSSMVRNGCSIIGKLLCPENQKMSSMIHEMPRLWRVNSRARGIALPNDKFQFIFDSESDLLTILETGAWTYNDWSMTLERWIENPPEDYLKIIPIWIRLRNIPVNFNTEETIKDFAEHIGQVTDVAFDPLKPRSRGYVRVRVLFDINRPLKNCRDLQLPTGEIEHCPFNPVNRQAIATGGVKAANIIPSRLIPKISKDDPLFGVLTDDDVGIDLVSGKPKIAKEVLDEMRQYISVVDQQEKKVRIERVRKSVWGLENDIQGQKTLLRLEAPARITTDINKGKGLVFDFEHANNTSTALPSSPRLASSPEKQDNMPITRQSSSTLFATASEDSCGSTVFRAGSQASPSGIKGKISKQRRRPSQWKRKAQARAKASGQLPCQEGKKNEVTMVYKRKATDEATNSSKLAKCDEVKGLGGTLTIPTLKEMRREHFPDFLFLMETKNSINHVKKVQQWMGYDHSHIVDPIGLSGGQALFWKSAYEVEIISSDHRIIDVRVKLGSQQFFISCVYGDPASHLRQEVWNSLIDIGVSRDDPWLVLGDLNEILNNTEKLGGPARAESSFFPFRNMINDCRLREVPSIGNKFSWAGDRNNQWIQCCLDRALGNEAWFHLFPRVQAEFLERIGSDHRPLFLRFVSENISRTGRFMFDKRWTSKPDLLNIIREGWNKEGNVGQNDILHRIAECRKLISRWKRLSSQNSKDRIKHLRNQLDNEGMKLQPHHGLMRSLRWNLAEAYREEELYWKLRSKEKWLRDGDRNTKFFHGSVQRRRVQNRILSLFDDNDLEQFSEGSKGEIAVDYFRKMFSSSTPSLIPEALDGMLPRVTDSMNQELTKPVTSEEIKKAVFNIRGDSTPGADGMSAHFYQTYWDIVGPQVIAEVKQFFQSGILPPEWNFTQICLIPKKVNPSRMTDLRPISLCSVIYKIVSKILCARLKVFLPSLISATQGAFVSGRLISDNILLAHEMIHALRTNAHCDEDFIAIKTDMSKAYDRVEWNFLEELLLRLGFNIVWVQWIMSCIKSVSYSVLLNGSSYGFIKPERGIRQGDPLSPFLFILCAEALVHIMNKSESEGRLTGLRLTPSCPSIQHLLFADDSLFLCQATFKECSEFKRCLLLYEKASGQMINFKKSAITFGRRLDPYMKQLIRDFTGIEQEGGTGKYLGLPECFSGSKSAMLGYISDRLKSRLSGWYEKTLSLGGKEVLIKSVALALPVYAMSCFRLTKYQCQQITSAMSSFWWNASEDKHKMHWVSWEKICKSKANGGLGFRDIGRFNQALLAKQAWRLLDDPQSLIARVYKAKYFANKSFLEAKIGYRPSYAWRSILFGKELLERGLMKTIGDGKNTSVWVDKWILDTYPRRPINKELMMDLNLKVSSLISSQGEWDVLRLTELFPPCDVTHIRSFPPEVSVPDRSVWAYTRDGKYSVKSGNWVLTREASLMEIVPANTQAINKTKERVWKITTAPKIRLFLWRVLSGALAIADCLRNHGLNVNPGCQICGSVNETISHVLFDCDMAQSVWLITSLPMWPQGSSFSIHEQVDHLLNLMEKQELNRELREAIPWLVWEIWKARNSTLYAAKTNSPHFVVATALEEAKEWLQQHGLVQQDHSHSLQRQGIGERFWTKPATGKLKCNIHSSWLKDSAHIGGAWILRNHLGDAIFHARDAFLPMVNRLAAELHVMFWCLRSLKELRIVSCEVWSDSRAAIDALTRPDDFPKYRSQIIKIQQVIRVMREVSFHFSSPKANSLAKDIACSVTREGRFTSYLARGGPAWLHNRIEDERRDRR
ncbi:hypothetical protein ISN44_As09g008890 [Arabidopsis suecica]|uniref:Reverse transcriptase domain-containing protein n=1 Tax=Arabidopsis suecica TaxID=45249 RepID=A0A8T2AIL7_ARASU|nr:hypothetical protein ISN44_As09g008890 [Arabidopsis suecica]